jgi:hypothetical protein
MSRWDSLKLLGAMPTTKRVLSDARAGTSRARPGPPALPPAADGQKPIHSHQRSLCPHLQGGVPSQIPLLSPAFDPTTGTMPVGAVGDATRKSRGPSPLCPDSILSSREAFGLTGRFKTTYSTQVLRATRRPAIDAAAGAWPHVQVRLCPPPWNCRSGGIVVVLGGPDQSVHLGIREVFGPGTDRSIVGPLRPWPDLWRNAGPNDLPACTSARCRKLLHGRRRWSGLGRRLDGIRGGARRSHRGDAVFRLFDRRRWRVDDHACLAHARTNLDLRPVSAGSPKDAVEQASATRRPGRRQRGLRALIELASTWYPTVSHDAHLSCAERPSPRTTVL